MIPCRHCYVMPTKDQRRKSHQIHVLVMTNCELLPLERLLCLFPARFSHDEFQKGDVRSRFSVPNRACVDLPARS